MSHALLHKLDILFLCLGIAAFGVRAWPRLRLESRNR